MERQQLTRRAFLRSASDAARGSAIVLSVPMILGSCSRADKARKSGEEFKLLTEAEAFEFEAISARIIPSDETPGATEAGVIYFIDNVLVDGRESEHLVLQNGLRELQSAAAATYAQPSFYQLNSVQQDQLLRDIENTEFFNTMRYLTIAGMFSLPEYGGNRDGIGFQLIGFENRHVWQPPFGFYDADYTERGQ